MIPIILMSIGIVLLFVVSALASAMEIAVEKSNKVRLNALADDGNKRAIKAKKHCDDFTSTLSTILLTNNIVNIGATSLATLIAIELAKKIDNLDTDLSSTISTIIITLLLLIVGEVLPKIYATEHADSFILKWINALGVVSFILKPIVFVSNKLVSFVSRIWKKKEEMPSVTQEELVSIVEEIQEEGVISEKESELIINAIELSDLTAQDILIPRVDISAIDLDDDITEILADLDRFRYSRIPVYKESLDNIIGILSTKKFVSSYVVDKETKIEDLMVKPYFVHMTKGVSSIFKEMKENRTKMAIVIDEYGGTMGIVTMEDILEEIFGEIYDENDIVELDTIKEADDLYLIDGSINLHDMFEVLEYDDRNIESEYTTAGGWVTEKLDKIPDEGDTFDFENYTFKVVEMDGMRVEKIEVKINEQPNEEV